MTELKVKDRGLYILIIILFLYSVLFSGIAIWRYEHFLCDDSGDQLLFEQVVYNTAHDKPFYNNFSHQSHFGDHNSPVLAVLAPFSRILPVPYVLYIFTVLSVAVSAIPIYLLSREYSGSKTLALMLAGGFLMSPAFIGQVYLSFHEMNLVLPFLTFTFYYFVRNRFYPFLAMFIMSLLVKEDVSLTLFMFAPYAFIKKRDRHWYIVPAILSVSWFLISIKVIIPYFNKNDSYGMALSYFSNLGSSLPEIVMNTISKPLNTLDIMLRPEKLRYLFVILLPVGLVLPFFSAEILFSIPSIFFNMLAGTQRFRFFTCSIDSDTMFIPRHMSLIAVVFIFISAVYSIRKVSLIFPGISRRLMVGLVLLLLSLTLYSDRFILSKFFYYEGSKLSQDLPSAASIKKLLPLIPYNSTVKADINIANHLYDRDDAYYPVNNPVDTDYVVITKMDTDNLDFTYVALIAYKYIKIASENNITLYKKRAI